MPTTFICDMSFKVVHEVFNTPVTGSTETKSVRGFKGRPEETLYP